jgi:AcrR family transcriptional regulator
MVRLLDGPDPEHVTVEEVLNESAISRGSLYHHFADFEELHETGLAYRITQWVNDSVASMSKILESAQSRQDVIEGVRAITAHSQDSRRRLNRLERARAFGLAGFSPRFQAVLGAEQARMTNALHDLIDESKRRGWIRTDIDSMATAVFIQAYTLGRVVDDISTEKVDPQKWNDLIGKIIVNHMFDGD